MLWKQFAKNDSNNRCYEMYSNLPYNQSNISRGTQFENYITDEVGFLSSQGGRRIYLPKEELGKVREFR